MHHNSIGAWRRLTVMTSVLVAGSSGLLGSSLVPMLRSRGLDVTSLSRSSNSDLKLDLCGDLDVLGVLDRVAPDVIINLVSLTSVEHCEEAPNAAYLLNSKSVRNLAEWISHSSPSTHLIQISTDHVYDGAGLHDEGDITIRNTYALSKLAGEIEAEKVNATILRTNFVGRSEAPHRESLTDWVYGSLMRREHVQVLSDVFFSPLSISTLNEIIYEVLRVKPTGVYNLGSRDGLSKSDFDFAFAELLGLPSIYMTPIESSSAKFLKATRPKNMLMDVSKFEARMNLRLPTLLEEIQKVADEYR